MVIRPLRISFIKKARRDPDQCVLSRSGGVQSLRSPKFTFVCRSSWVHGGGPDCSWFPPEWEDKERKEKEKNLKGRVGGDIRVYGRNKGARSLFSCGQRDLCRLSEAQPQAGNLRP